MATPAGETLKAADSKPKSDPIPLSRRDILDIVRKHSEALPRPAAYGEPPAPPVPKGPPEPRPWEKHFAEMMQGSKGKGTAAGSSLSSAPVTANESPSLANVSDESDSAVMDPRYWKEIFKLYFVENAGGRGGHAGDPNGQVGGGERTPGEEHVEALFDDMLFFVRQERSAFGQMFNFFKNFVGSEAGQSAVESEEKAKPYFVRRWGCDLDSVLGDSAGDVDWRRSYYLNLICHTEYSLTVAICRRQDLDAHRRSHKAPVPPLYKVTKRVYASPNKSRFDMENSKAQETLPSYPEICFSVDDYDDTFEAVVLEHPDHCLCVLLNAHGGAAFPLEDSVEKTFRDGQKRVFRRGTSNEAKALGEAQEGVPKISLFCGFVSYPLVLSAFGGGGGPGFSLFGSSGPQSPKAEKLVMRGPGGRGEAEVAVMRVREERAAAAGVPTGKGASSTITEGAGVAPSGSRVLSNQSSKDQGGPQWRKQVTMEELQKKLGAVQQRLTSVVQEQQHLQQQRKATANSASSSSSGTVQSIAELSQLEEENQQTLQQLQAELADLHGQLEALNKGYSPRGGSPARGAPSRSSPLGNGSSDREVEDAAQEFQKKARAGPVRRTAVHNESGSDGGKGAGRLRTTGQVHEQLDPLRCCLMSLSLPWDLLVFDLLFKEMPIEVQIGGRIFPPKRPGM